MSLPIATVISLLKEQGMVGCLGNLYESIENLNETYIQPNQHKEALLKPTGTTSVPLFLLQGRESSAGKIGYRCSYSCSYSYYSDDSHALCSSCGRLMTMPMTYVAPPVDVVKAANEGGGFVKGVVTYMVMDDLVVKPMSTISSLTLLTQFNVKDISALNEKEVLLGFEEAVKLLKTSLHSKEVLTSVFLKNN